MRRKARSCRERSANSSNTRISSGKKDAVPGFPWPPPVVEEFRAIFRPRPKLSPPPEPKGPS